MKSYLAVIHKEGGSEYGVSFPDFPGCITSGETLDKAKDLAQEALDFHIVGVLEDGEPLPAPSTLETVTADERFQNAAAFFVVRPQSVQTPAVRFNATMDSKLLAAIDHRARNLGMSRSGYLASLARKDLG